MSSLPQRKKTPEEIAKLREQLGVPFQAAPPPSQAAAPPPAQAAAPPPAQAAPHPQPKAGEQDEEEFIWKPRFEKIICATERAQQGLLPRFEEVLFTPSEEVPAFSAETFSAEVPSIPAKEAPSIPPKETPSIPPKAPHAPPLAAKSKLPPARKATPQPKDEARRARGRRVTSLRKSEQAAAEPRPQKHREDSKIPVRRHSEDEIEEMRRREMLSHLKEPPINPKFMKAHPVLITFAYLLAAGGASIFLVDGYPWSATIASCLAALLLAGFIFKRRPVSRHHAGFVSAISVLVGVFATVQHFPQLHHAS